MLRRLFPHPLLSLSIFVIWFMLVNELKLISALMALSDAVAACGDGSIYPALDAPATAERVLAAVARVRGDV